MGWLICSGMAWASLPRVVSPSGTGLPALTLAHFWDGLNHRTGSAFLSQGRRGG
jgi:hypothetical protein